MNHPFHFEWSKWFQFIYCEWKMKLQIPSHSRYTPGSGCNRMGDEKKNRRFQSFKQNAIKYTCIGPDCHSKKCTILFPICIFYRYFFIWATGNGIILFLDFIWIFFDCVSGNAIELCSERETKNETKCDWVKLRYYRSLDTSNIIQHSTPMNINDIQSIYRRLWMTILNFHDIMPDSQFIDQWDIVCSLMTETYLSNNIHRLNVINVLFDFLLINLHHISFWLHSSDLP